MRVIYTAKVEEVVVVAVDITAAAGVVVEAATVLHHLLVMAHPLGVVEVPCLTARVKHN